MSYEGEILNSCGVINVDFSKANIVAVSGDGINGCGHLLLFSPAGGGYYFHVAGLRTYPRYMSESGYRRYLKETKKSELRRRELNLPDPAAALRRMESLLAEKWTWGVLPNNCVAFVEEIIAAGGGNWNSYSNCPAVATADPPGDQIGRFFQWMESEVYGVYGVGR